MEPERQTPPPAPIPQITLPPLGSAPLPTLAGSPALPPADSMVPRRGGSVFWRVAALLVLGFLLLASLGPVFLLWNFTADSPDDQREREVSGDVAARNSLVRDDMVTALSRLNNDWLLYGHSPDEEGFCSRVRAIVESQIAERLEGDDAGRYAAMGITLDSYPTEQISCDESARSFVATVPLPLDDGARSKYCVSSAGGSGLGKVPTFDSGCGETYETPTALPGTPEYEFRLSVGGGAESFAAPTFPDAAPIVAQQSPALSGEDRERAVLDVLSDASDFAQEYASSRGGSYKDLCFAPGYHETVEVPLSRLMAGSACQFGEQRGFAAEAYFTSGERYCADWTLYAGASYGIVDDGGAISCDFVDPPWADLMTR